MIAARAGAQAVVQVLLEAGADVNAANRDGVTALMQASRLQQVAIIKQLIDAGAEPRALDMYGRRALIYAGEKGPPPAVITRLLGGAAGPAKSVKTAGSKPWWKIW